MKFESAPRGCFWRAALPFLPFLPFLPRLPTGIVLLSTTARMLTCALSIPASNPPQACVPCHLPRCYVRRSARMLDPRIGTSASDFCQHGRHWWECSVFGAQCAACRAQRAVGMTSTIYHHPLFWRPFVSLGFFYADTVATLIIDRVHYFRKAWFCRRLQESGADSRCSRPGQQW